MADKSNGAILIGEHEIAAGFSSFWSEALPLLTPACVTTFNRTRGDYLEGFRPVDREMGITGADLSWPDLYAEAAFELFRASHEENIHFREVVANDDLLTDAWRIAERSISLHRRLVPESIPSLGSVERQYLLAVGRRYDALRGLFSFEGAEFGPRVAGCGVLGACEADLSLGTTLVEVKTVDRNFNAKDIKQVVLYLALDHLSGAKRWEDVLLFNPRRSFMATFTPGEFLEYVSAGKRAAQVYREIEVFLLHRDFTPEHSF